MHALKRSLLEDDSSWKVGMGNELAKRIRWSAVWAFAVVAPSPLHADETLKTRAAIEPITAESSIGIEEVPRNPRPAWISGWGDMGFTASTVGAGRLLVEPRPNHLGNEFLLNQLALDMHHLPDPNQDSLGYRVQLLAGSDAWLLSGPGDPQNDNVYFGFVVRQVYISAHFEIFGERGVDLKAGRVPSLLGYESYQAPMRSLYSMSYQWFYAADGCDTGAWGTWHVDDHWDLTAGIYLGSNTFFELRGDAPCGVVQVLRNRDDSGNHYQACTIVFGDQAIGQGNSALLEGKNQVACEYRHQVPISDRVSQVVQINVGRSDRVLGNHHGVWYGALGANQWSVTEKLRWQCRYEWFYDNGTRTDFDTNYFAGTVGALVQPRKNMTLRPELRGDLAGVPAFGTLGDPNRKRQQLTAAMDVVFTF